MENKNHIVLSETMTPNQLGQALANACSWDGTKVAEAFLAALTDANWHTERTALEPLIKHLFKLED